ncbi:DUF2496 domain-containing protein [Shewanella sp.]|uniref:DUF2496 domain-containing protein n=1 Tax=Shewanella sp. TaxID=50422 RepID=UPI001ECE1188|nr:DUF2496 domain-containing protein [Shewanella sp.]NRB23718.1 DUF2496 domain-containing protein [Shewanella sp.]
MPKLNKPGSQKVPTNTAAPASSLDDAADEVKLAVDLIYLFESSKIEVEVALAAIEIVKADLMSKQGKLAG